MTNEKDTDCCIVGGGPAGMLLALMLARSGARITLLEMHHDFDRDFRGDTVHAATLELLDQLGLAQAVLALPHAKMQTVDLHIASRTFRIADFKALPSPFPYVMVMPQSEFLGFLATRLAALPNVSLQMGAQVVALLRQGKRVTGVRYRHEGGHVELRALVTIACDGRFSQVRKLAGVTGEGSAPPMDVAWFRLPKRAADPVEAGTFFVGAGRLLVLLSRVHEWQLGYIFPKGDFSAIRAEGIEHFRASIATRVPWLIDRVELLGEWSQVHLLVVKSDCLERWHEPGLLFLGDAAHVMSPVGGVGINFAIADAVVAANVLHEPLARGRLDDAMLAEVQRQREGPTRRIQRFQSFVQQRIIAQALRGRAFSLPWPARALLSIPYLRDVPARAFALGIGRPRLDPRLVQQPSGPNLQAS